MFFWNFASHKNKKAMTRYDKYIFATIFMLCLVMIFACNNKNPNREEIDGSSVATPTTEGTISTGTVDTSATRSNGLNAEFDSVNREIPVKGETVPPTKE